jgi:hypothetical protein
MLKANCSTDTNEFLRAGRALVSKESEIVNVTKDGEHYFYYINIANIHRVISGFLSTHTGIPNQFDETPKEPKRVKIEVATQIDGRELTQAEQTLLKVREKFNFFKNMTDAEVLTVSKDVGMMRLNKNETLFRQGTDGDQVFFIVRGVVSIQINKTAASRVEVAKLHSGAIFGEMSPVTKEKRSATVVCVEDNTTVLTFRLGEKVEEETAMAYAKMYHNFTFILAEKIINQNKILVGAK